MPSPAVYTSGGSILPLRAHPPCGRTPLRGPGRGDRRSGTGPPGAAPRGGWARPCAVDDRRSGRPCAAGEGTHRTATFQEDIATNPETRAYVARAVAHLHRHEPELLVVGNDGWQHVS